MKIGKQVSEDQMIADFLRAELDSDRFSSYEESLLREFWTKYKKIITET
jgi:hypothetical protein